MLTRLTAFDDTTPSDFAKDLLLGQYVEPDNKDDAYDIERSFHEWIRRRHQPLGLIRPSDYAAFITDTLVPLGTGPRRVRGLGLSGYDAVGLTGLWSAA